jgi:hypothetical protein
MRNAYKILVGNVKVRNSDVGVDGKMIREWIVGKRAVRCGLDTPGSR